MLLLHPPPSPPRRWEQISLARSVVAVDLLLSFIPQPSGIRTIFSKFTQACYFLSPYLLKNLIPANSEAQTVPSSAVGDLK
jgi:hypothetical protein